MSMGGVGLGGENIGSTPAVLTAGIWLSPNLWPAYTRLLQVPALIEDRRVGHEQAAMLIRAFDQPVKVSVVDERKVVRACSQSVGQMFTRVGASLIIGEAAKPKITVIEPGDPTPAWQLVVTCDDGSSLRGSFGLWGSDADFVWGRTTFRDGQSFGFKRSLIMTQTQVSVQPPPASGDFLYCNSRIVGTTNG